jgi:leucyl-tRNA synthetase
MNKNYYDILGVQRNASDDDIKKAALADEKVAQSVDGKEIKKVIVIKNRLVNIVVG